MYFFSPPPPPFFPLCVKFVECKGLFANHVILWHALFTILNCILYAMKHRRGWEGATPESAVARCGVRRLTPLPACFCRAEPGQFSQNRVVSAESDCLGRWPKKAEIGLELFRNSRNRLWMRPKHPKSIISQFYSEYLLLLLCFLFCFVFLAFFFLCFVNQGHSNVFFKNILIVNI